MRKSNAGTSVFEITDYTNSTEFEELIHSVEQTIENWGLRGGSTCENVLPLEFNRTESLIYHKQSFKFTHSRLNLPSVDRPFQQLQQAHFPPKTHCINRWFGFSEFLILSPETTEDAIYFLDSSKLLLSSLASALTRTQCKLPIFIQLGSPSKRFYSGIWLYDSIQTTLEMVLLKSPPPQCSSIKEILCFYKRSIPCAVSPFPHTFISIRYTFGLHNFIGCLKDNHVYKQNDELLQFKLPFGCVRDPIQDILLATSWVGHSEHLISDSESGELDPLKATVWSLWYTNTSNPFCSLYNFIDYVRTLCSNTSTLISILGTSVDDDLELDVSSAFRSLTETPALLQVPSLDLTMLPGKLLGSQGTLVDHQVLATFMHYIFQQSYPESVLKATDSRVPLKTCPKDSITSRIAVSLCLVLCNHGGIKGFAQLWRCVVEQFRSHLERSQLIPGASSQPNPAFSLLHQKIQMLNACIAQKIEREASLDKDCVDCSTAHPSLSLLLTGEVLRVPATQNHPPMTEDMQEDHIKLLSQLGSDAEGSRLRTQLQSRSLMSDMQAFKDANRDCRLEDFIRWYSPRDWIVVPVTSPLIPAPTTVTDIDEVPHDPACEEREEDKTPSTGDQSEEGSERVAVGDVLLDVSNSEQDTASVEEDDTGVVGHKRVSDDKDEMETGVSDDKREMETGVSDDKDEMETRVSDDKDEMEARLSDDKGEMVTGVSDDKCEMDTVLSDDKCEMETGVSDDEVSEMEAKVSGDEMETNSSDEEFVDAEENPLEPERSEYLSVSEVSSERHVSPVLGEDEATEPHPSSTAPHPSPTTPTKHEPPPSPTTPIEPPLDPFLVGGHLSVRMSNNSVWKELWYKAKPTPIRHQKRLFDDTKEAEKILHGFTYCTVRDISGLILPALCEAAYERVLECPEREVSVIRSQIEALYASLRDLLPRLVADAEALQEILTEIYKAELLASKYHSLKNKLERPGQSTGLTEPSKKISELEKRTRRNIRGPRLTAEPPATPPTTFNEETQLTDLLHSEVCVEGAARSPWGSVLQRLFHAQQAAAAPAPPPRHIPTFPLPIGREYILQTTTRHPSPLSREAPQRMFVTVSGNEFRMAFASSSDKTFL